MKHNKKISIYRAVISGGIGNVVEWYTFIGYGFLVDVISEVFFPKQAIEQAIIFSFLLFSIGFLARPLGAFLFGYLGDKIGRQKTLIISQLLMMLTTGIICFLPTYSMIGVQASILLALCRFLQGISVAGEYTTSLCYLAEISSNNQRGKIVSTIPAGTAMGIMISSLVVFSFRSFLSHHELLVWGWRLCFFFGFMLSLIGVYLRWFLPETETFLDVRKIQKLQKNSLLSSLKKKTNLITMIHTVIIVMAYAYLYQLLYIWFPTFLKIRLSFNYTYVLFMNVCMMVIFIGSILYSGYLSDRFTRKKIMIATSILILLLFPLLFNFVMIAQSTVSVLVFWSIFSIVFGGFVGATSAHLSESYTPEIRSTALSLSYNLPYSIFGGLAPTVLSFYNAKGYISSISYTTVGIFLVAMVVCFFILDKTRKDIGVVRNGEKGHA